MTETEKELLWEDLSSRTQKKIIKRAVCECSICGWNESTLDLHHIKHVKDGGKDTLDNLIAVCPNCHRCIHTIPNWKSEEYLLERSLKDLDWIKYYNPNGQWSASKKVITKICDQCGKEFQSNQSSRKYCSVECSRKASQKVERPDKKTLDMLLKKHTMVYIGRKYGVTDNSVRKWANQYGIEWRKIKSSG